MYKELSVTIGEKKHKAFFKSGFFQPQVQTSYLHKHNYTEVHIIFGGNSTYVVDDKQYELKNGNMVTIPRNTFHGCIHKDEHTQFVAFQINYDVESTDIYFIGKEILGDFFNEMERAKTTLNYTTLSSYLSLFCSYFCNDAEIPSQSVTDYAFLIYEFFSTYYTKDVRLDDLAQMLHLSPRQTERLVIEHTGRTFKEELIAIRMNIAKKLLETSDMPLTEIARYVGYKSYAGFWKAAKKYGIC